MPVSSAATGNARGPERRTIDTAPAPPGVAGATIVVSSGRWASAGCLVKSFGAQRGYGCGLAALAASACRL